jgi:hypothetical protein
VPDFTEQSVKGLHMLSPMGANPLTSLYFVLDNQYHEAGRVAYVELGWLQSNGAFLEAVGWPIWYQGIVKVDPTPGFPVLTDGTQWAFRTNFVKPSLIYYWGYETT